MIKVTKDLTAIPESLKPATVDFFPPPSNIPRPAKTTHMHRLKIIADGFYTDETKYNLRYKYSDVREALGQIYHGKCAYCEQKIELSHVEHYRPKYTYYWLAYSWDNLILSCPHCNEYKGVNFQLAGTRAIFANNAANILDINNLSSSYEFRESPSLVNPELTNPLPHLRFNKLGEVFSNEGRFAYTITICKISRKYLNDDRRKLLQDFKSDIAAELTKRNKNAQLAGVQAIVDKFKRDAMKPENTYLGFRRFAIRQDWLREIIKEKLNAMN